ncbi:MAG TPA: amidohydrolase family protein [Gemmatimonadales bacterium]|nr:amidohydrolase family protein [Gemmatimonadales bacterium]
MLIDVHAHFHTERSIRGDWRRINHRRLEAGRQIGITAHVASIPGSYGTRSPLYFPSPEDVRHGNDALAGLCAEHRGLVFGYCVVNPNYPDQAVHEIETRVAAGFIGIKLLASRRADDPLLDRIAEAAARHGVPILHHIWQHRRHEWPGQEASDAAELATLAARHPGARFILAHLGGGGDWQHSLRVLRGVPNVWVDLSGSGLDTGMVEAALESVGVGRLLWGADITLDTALARLRYLETLLGPQDMAAVRHGNAQAVFPRGAFA